MLDLAPLQPVDYLVIGHITQDLRRDGARLGGTATYAARTAQALGLRAGVVTSANEKTSWEAFNGIRVICIPSEDTTTFENIYDSEDGRRQILHHPAAHISLEL